MKSCMVTAVTLLLCGAMVSSAAGEMQNWRAGAHGAYSMGGDVEESEVGYGAQAEFSISGNWGIELSASQFSDEYSSDGISLESDLTSVGLSIVCRAPLIDRLHGFMLAGCNYNMTDMDAAVDPAVAEGLPVAASIDIDDAVGFHLGAGLGMAVVEDWELFVEYRYTILELEGDLTASVMGRSATVEFEGDYDFGLLKAGVNYCF